jgi:GNAT superfamily N-acetyltransferase
MADPATNTPRITVRIAADGDFDALAALQWQWRIEEWGRRAESSVAAFRAAFKTWAAAHGHSHIPFVAVRDATPVGMAWLAVIERVPTPHRWTRLAATLQSVYIVPGTRNSGAGASLVRAVLDHARSLGVDYVLVHPSERSFPFYRRLGFAETGRHLELLLQA